MLSPSCWHWCWRRRWHLMLIDHNSYTHLGTPLVFGTQMPWDKTFPCMPNINSVTLTLESALRFQNLRLGFENYS